MMRSWGMEGRVQETKASRLCDCGNYFFYLFIFFEIAWAKSEEHALLYNLSTEIFPTSNNWLCHSISISTQPIFGRHKCDPCPSPKFS